eukprot:TRINITY_DN2492_c0_g1_i1.p1 TRINITY_DN2492_c0_g1~~TRINITY_DN2492_c0_g1_i1.p1  ORF type:complete len:356 (+),score=96.39 TRINITY_DN2492_c0_g1_i1:43-1110(+)
MVHVGNLAGLNDLRTIALCVGDEVVLGRSPALPATHRYDNPKSKLSGRHCRFFVKDVGGKPTVHVADLSKNGTYVDGNNVSDISATREWALPDRAQVYLTNPKKTAEKDAVGFLVCYVDDNAPTGLPSSAAAAAVKRKADEDNEPEARIPIKRAKMDPAPPLPVKGPVGSDGGASLCSDEEEEDDEEVDGDVAPQKMNLSCQCTVGGGALTTPLNEVELTALPAKKTHWLEGNSAEQAILTEYMATHGKTANDVWKACREKLLLGEWHPNTGRSKKAQAVAPLSWTSPAKAYCQFHWEIVFGGLLYHYRRAIPPHDLPAKVTSRGDCWYGVDCRTQHHKAPHAAKLNHICPNIKA